MVCRVPHFYFSYIILLAIPWAIALLKPVCKWLCLCVWCLFTCVRVCLNCEHAKPHSFTTSKSPCHTSLSPRCQQVNWDEFSGPFFSWKDWLWWGQQSVVLSLPTSPSPEWWCVLLPSNWRCHVQIYLRTVSEHNSQYIFNEETNKQKTGGHLVNDS